MAKELVASRLMVNLDVNSEFDGGLLLYKVKENGVLGKVQKSIEIKNMPISLLNLATIIGIVIEKTKEQEGIDV